MVLSDEHPGAQAAARVRAALAHVAVASDHHDFARHHVGGALDAVEELAGWVRFARRHDGHTCGSASTTVRKCPVLLLIFTKVLRKNTTRLSWLYGRGFTG
jgi:hypothetical protein